MLTPLFLALVACVPTAMIRATTPGGSAGEVYVLADVVSYGGPTVTSLLRCVETPTETGWTTSCHTYLTGEEAQRAALATGSTTHNHSKAARPGK